MVTSFLYLLNNKKRKSQTISNCFHAHTAANHTETGYFDQKHTLGLWKGNILMEMNEAKQNGTLSDMMVAMASIGKRNVYIKNSEQVYGKTCTTMS